VQRIEQVGPRVGLGLRGRVCRQGSPEVSKPRRRDHLKAMSDEISGTCQALVPPAAGSMEDKDG
jgi:hypothetical protein